MIIAEYTLDHPFLRETLRRVPGIALTWQYSYTDPSGRMRVIASIDAEDDRVLDRAIDDDPTVADPAVLNEAGDRRLYRLDLVGEAADKSIMPTVIEVGGVQLGISATREGWHNRTRFPSREAFERVYRFCLHHDLDFEFHRIFEQAELFSPETPNLSDAQRETLIEAVESGYLDIPRGSSLEELGERIGVSESAASERFRRGVKKLVEGTIYPDAEATPR